MFGILRQIVLQDCISLVIWRFFFPLQRTHLCLATCQWILSNFCLSGSLPGASRYSGSLPSHIAPTHTQHSDSLMASVDLDVNFYRGHTFAASTSRTYATQKLVYFEFCSKLSIAPIPLSQYDLGWHIVYLSRKLCFSSVREYLNIVRILHVDVGLPNPLEHNWYVSSILKGVCRVKGDASKQKLPITFDILGKIFTKIDLFCSLDRTFWAACLVAFYSFFDKSNLLIPALEVFDPSRHLCASDAKFISDGVIYQ